MAALLFPATLLRSAPELNLMWVALKAVDLARFYDPVCCRHRRIEHWDNAVKQGRIAAQNMLDRRQSCRDVSYFFSEVFDIAFNFIGDVQGHDQRVLRTTVPDESFAVLYLKDDHLKAG